VKANFVFTSESVTEGHPDKLCDQISDAIVDHFLAADPWSRIVAECAVANGVIFIAARFVSTASVDIPQVAREVIRQVGYSGEDFNANDCTILTNFTELAESERVAVDERELSSADHDRRTAKNHATVFGFACNQTRTMMPMPIWLAHQLAMRLSQVRKDEILSYLLPDATIQVAIEYRNRAPYRVHSMNLVASHRPLEEQALAAMRTDLIQHVFTPIFEREEVHFDTNTKIFINPEGPFIGGGPAVHSGLTGRKTAADLYGQYCRPSGSALSGKDPARIDRTGTYIARYAARNIVAAGLAEQCEVQLSYTIGQAQPVSIQVESYGTGKVDDDELAKRIKQHLDFRPSAVIAQFNLRHQKEISGEGFYRKLAAYGQVGRADLDLPWERTDKADLLR
jgi:S-adenosylmethionine synthetase